MPNDAHTTEYRIVLHRIGPSAGMFSAPGFSVLIQAKDTDDALRQAKQLASTQGGQFKIVDVHRADRTSGPASSE